MNRRKFLRNFVAAVATVAIGLKLHDSMPEAEPQEWIYVTVDGVRQVWKFDYRFVILDPNAIARVNTV